jgi:hypothetical protein
LGSLFHLIFFSAAMLTGEHLRVSEIAAAALVIGTPIFCLLALRSRQRRAVLVWTAPAVVALTLQLLWVFDQLYTLAAFPKSQSFWNGPERMHGLFAIGVVYAALLLGNLLLILPNLVASFRAARTGKGQSLKRSEPPANEI